MHNYLHNGCVTILQLRLIATSRDHLRLFRTTEVLTYNSMLSIAKLVTIRPQGKPRPPKPCLCCFIFLSICSNVRLRTYHIWVSSTSRICLLLFLGGGFVGKLASRILRAQIRMCYYPKPRWLAHKSNAELRWHRRQHD